MNNYAVYRIFRDHNKRAKVLMDGLTREQAQTIVQNTPSYEDSMVVFRPDAIIHVLTTNQKSHV